jgi:hypothetical protein
MQSDLDSGQLMAGSELASQFTQLRQVSFSPTLFQKLTEVRHLVCLKENSRLQIELENTRVLGAPVTSASSETSFQSREAEAIVTMDSLKLELQNSAEKVCNVLELC